MADESSEIMQSVKLDVDGVVHNVALSLSTSQRLLAGDPDTISAVVAAIRASTTNVPEQVPKPEPVFEELLASTSTETFDEIRLPVDPSQDLGTGVEAVLQYEDKQFEDSESEDDASYHWTEQPTWKFLEVYKSMAHRFHGRNEKKVHLWDDMAKKMEEFGYITTGAQLNGRFKTLKYRYRRCVSGKSSLDSFPYFNEMKNIFTQEEKANSITPFQLGGEADSEMDTSVSEPNKFWTRSQALQLIAQYKSRENRFRNSVEKKKFLWSEVSEALTKQGVTCTGEQCEGKWKSLTRAFRKAKALGLKNKSFPYYTELSELCSEMDATENSSMQKQETNDEEIEEDTQNTGNRWNKASVTTLLAAYKQLKNHFLGDETRPFLWEQLSGVLQEEGYHFSADQIQVKWKSLLNSFRRAQMSASSRSLFIHFDEMSEILGAEQEGITEQELITQDLVKRWSTNVMMAFLKECEKNHDAGTFIPSKHLFLEISEAMEDAGYIFSGDQLDRKWKRLKEQYFSYTTLGTRFDFCEEIAKLSNLTNQKKKPSWKNKPIQRDTDVADETQGVTPGDKLWTDSAIRLFLEECQSRKESFSSTRKRGLWNALATAMQNKGYKLQPYQIEHKWKNLVRSYRAVESTPDQSQFRYFKQMSDIMGCYQTRAGPLAVDHQWTEAALAAFVKIYTEKRCNCDSEEAVSDKLYDEVSTDLYEKGFDFTRDQLIYRWKMLISAFKKASKLENPKEEFQYYDEIKEFAEREDVDHTYTEGRKLFGNAVRCSCGKMKKQADTHVNGCVSCMGCDEENTCEICDSWDPSTWKKFKKIRPLQTMDTTSDHEDLMDTEALTWTDDAINIFLGLCSEQKSMLALDRKRQLWLNIASGLKDEGYNVNSYQVENKWKTMYRRMKHVRDSKALRDKFPYYDQVQELAVAYEDKSFYQNFAADDRWTVKAVGMLLKDYSSRRPEYEAPLSKSFWEEVSNHLASNGLDFNPEQVAYRFKMLLQAFSKAELSERPREYFAYYDQMKEIVGDRSVENDLPYFLGRMFGVRNQCLCGEVKSISDTHTAGCYKCLGCTIHNACEICENWSHALWKRITKMKKHHKKSSPSKTIASDGEETSNDKSYLDVSDEDESTKTDKNPTWTPEAIDILLDEYKLRKAEMKTEPQQNWREIANILADNGHEFSTRQLETKFKDLVKQYFKQKRHKKKFEHAPKIGLIFGSRRWAATPSRAMSSRLRAQPKRKFPRDADEADTRSAAKRVQRVKTEVEDMEEDELEAIEEAPPSPINTRRSVRFKDSNSVSVLNSRNSQFNRTESETNGSPAKKTKMTELQSFLRDFVEKQIETEERSFQKFKNVHDNKIKNLKSLLSTLESD